MEKRISLTCDIFICRYDMTVIALIPYDGGFLLASDSRATLRLDGVNEQTRLAWSELLSNDFGVEHPENISEVYLYAQKVRDVADGIVVAEAGLERLDRIVKGVIAAHADELRDSSADFAKMGNRIESDIRDEISKSEPSSGNGDLAVLFGTVKRNDESTAAFEVVVETGGSGYVTKLRFKEVGRHEFLAVGPPINTDDSAKNRTKYYKYIEIAHKLVMGYGYDPTNFHASSEFEAQVIAYRLIKLGEMSPYVGDPIEMRSTARDEQLWLDTDNLLGYGEKVYMDSKKQKVKIGAWIQKPSKIGADADLQEKVRAAAKLEPALFRLNKDILANTAMHMSAKEFDALIDDIRTSANKKLRRTGVRASGKSPEIESD